MSSIHDTLYDVLANEQRRQLLFALVEQSARDDSPITLDAPPDEPAPDERARIAYEHVHLPKLDDCGFIEWTPSMKCVETGPRFDEIRPTLELLVDHHENTVVKSRASTDERY